MSELRDRTSGSVPSTETRHECSERCSGCGHTLLDHTERNGMCLYIDGAWMCDCAGFHSEEQSRFDRLQAENKRLRVALGKYGTHDYPCPADPHTQTPCTCGLDEALAGSPAANEEQQ